MFISPKIFKKKIDKVNDEPPRCAIRSTTVENIEERKQNCGGMVELTLENLLSMKQLSVKIRS